MRTRHLGCMAAMAAFVATSAMAASRCQLQQVGTLPVEMQDLRPLVQAKIDGVEARFLLDSGSFYSSISRDAARQYRLPLTSLGLDNVAVVGLGGGEAAQRTTVKDFDFMGMPLHDIPFMVFSQDAGSDVAGLIGQNVLRISDVEYDLADGIVRFFKPAGCDKQALAYWATKTPYSYVDLQSMDVIDPHLRTTALVNGQRVTVWFDTGASRSVLSLQAAERAGITPSSPGVKFLGIGYGIGPAPAKMWDAPVDNFQIGGEKVAHTHLLIADYQPRDSEGYVSRGFPDLTLGDDFFLSHRIYVAYGQNKLYFTYNGGPLFDLDLPQPASAAAAASKPGSTTGDQSLSNAPTDADGFKRRGMAYASMQEYDRALADLTRACELAPSDAGIRDERGAIYIKVGQFNSALQDFDAAVAAQPNDIDARMARARLLQSHLDTDPASAPKIKSDLDAVSGLAAPGADVRLTLSDMYEKLGDYSAAIGQIDQWLDIHRLASDEVAGLNTRCWLRAAANRDLQQALDDCNHALALKPSASAEIGSLIGRDVAPANPAFLDSRGLVYLRLGDLKAAIRDYDTALQIDPSMPTALYARGLAELREGQKTQGETDLAAAGKLYGGIAKFFANMGLAP